MNRGDSKLCYGHRITNYWLTNKFVRSHNHIYSLAHNLFIFSLFVWNAQCRDSSSHLKGLAIEEINSYITKLVA